MITSEMIRDSFYSSRFKTSKPKLFDIIIHRKLNKITYAIVKNRDVNRSAGYNFLVYRFDDKDPPNSLYPRGYATRMEAFISMAKIYRKDLFWYRIVVGYWVLVAAFTIISLLVLIYPYV